MDTLTTQHLFYQIIITILGFSIGFLLLAPIYWAIVERKNVKQKQWKR